MESHNAFASRVKIHVQHIFMFTLAQVIVMDNYFTGSKDNLKQWIGHPRFELIRHGMSLFYNLQILSDF